MDIAVPSLTPCFSFPLILYLSKREMMFQLSPPSRFSLQVF